MKNRLVYILFNNATESDYICFEQITSVLTDKRIKVLSELVSVEYKQSIRGFLRAMAQDGKIIMIISDSFLKSTKCMQVATGILDKVDFYDRIFPIVMPEANVLNPVGMITYFNYWDNKINELNQKMKQLSALNHMEAINTEINLYVKIRSYTGNFMQILNQMFYIQYDDVKQKNFDVLIRKLLN